MEYTVLSRKWRPKTFDNVVGQSHITTILKNSIEQNKVSHAYLFSGPRGVGKTTVARIMSCMLNNVELIENSIDIVELDGASNRGIDEIRDIKESARYAPAQGKYKIFIIDESHMLTKEAFNALLKTLEEPPPHVLFILATTEYHKLPLTIISRCQRYTFKRISTNTTVSYLSKILKEEGFESDEKALKAISSKSEGSLRDSLSLLDKVITLCNDNMVSSQIVENALGIIDEKEYLGIIKHILNEDLDKTLESVDLILNEGTPIVNFVDGFNSYLKNILYYYANYKKDAVINEDVIEVFKNPKLGLRVVSKLLDVNLDYLIRFNKNLTDISLENHFIKIFSYVNKGKEKNKSSSLKKQEKLYNDKDGTNKNSLSKDSLKDHENSIIESKTDLDIKNIYSEALKYVEKNNYKLYCVLVKCEIDINDQNSIIIKSDKLTKYEQSSITMDIDKLNSIINNIANENNSNQDNILVTFNNLESSNAKQELTGSQEKSRGEPSILSDEEDHPLFDSVLDELEGKLLK